MEEKKYELLKDDTMEIVGHAIYRIKALKNFGNVKKGDLGGYIESENNLSHEDNCWVYGYAKIYDNAKVLDNAIVANNAEVYGCAVLSGNAAVFDSARICGDAKIRDNAKVYGSARIYSSVVICCNAVVCGRAIVCGDLAVIRDNVWVYDNAEVYGNAILCGNSCISYNARVSSKFDYCAITGFGSMAGTTTFFKCKDGTIGVNCGCFNGTLGEFREKVNETHGNNEYAKEYLMAADLAELRLAEED